MELSSAGDHIVENNTNIQILTEDLSVLSLFSQRLVSLYSDCSAPHYTL